MNSNEAEENLRVIRSLMEKATIYRAISAPTALVGGLAASVAGVALATTTHSFTSPYLVFMVVWLSVLALTAASNAFFLHRDARRRGEQFISPGMKMALRALFPSHFAAAVMTSLVFARGMHFLCDLLPYLWCIFYGIGLLSMNHFAPRSITRLGSVFLLTGLLMMVSVIFDLWSFFSRYEVLANYTMAVTFGLFHLIYAACTWPRGGRKVIG